MFKFLLIILIVMVCVTLGFALNEIMTTKVNIAPTAINPSEPKDGTLGVCAKEARIDDLKGGMTVTTYMPIYNYTGEAQAVKLFYKYPDSRRPNYSAPPDGFESWLTIPKDIILEGHEIRQVEFSLYVPKGQDLPKKWEFWLALAKEKPDMVDGVTVEAEMCTRWYAIMR